MVDLIKKYPNLFEIDANLNRLVQRIELIKHVNPTNIEGEKQRFFASKFNENPQFKYPKIKFDPYKLHRLFFSQRLERIKDERIRNLYQEIIYYYSNMIQCIETIGSTPNFFYNSLKVYGSPTEKDVQNAHFILHFTEDDLSNSDKKYNAQDAKAYFESYMRHFSFPLNIRFSNHIASDAMVSNSEKALILKQHARFSENQLHTLASHEIGLHLVTTFNADNQPLKILSNGFPKNVETQEGLAVLCEYLSGALTFRRLKELAYRVLAADCLVKGYSFKDTFDLIHVTYKLEREKAFIITLRAYRGGGFTKDRLYLSGLIKIYQKYRRNEDLELLITGKVSLDYENELAYLKSLGLVVKPVHRSIPLTQNENKNETLRFILGNLK